MVYKHLCILVLWTIVASALEGLSPLDHFCQTIFNRKRCSFAFVNVYLEEIVSLDSHSHGCICVKIKNTFSGLFTGPILLLAVRPTALPLTARCLSLPLPDVGHVRKLPVSWVHVKVLLVHHLYTFSNMTERVTLNEITRPY